MSLQVTAQPISPFVIIEKEPEHSDHPEINVDPECCEEESVELSVGEPNCIEVADNDNENALEVVIQFCGDLPGAADSPEPVEPIKPVEKKDDDNLEVMEVDENDAKKPKKSDRWDWESKGASGFVVWVKERFATVPKHSGYDTSGLERAVSYLEKLDSEISKAMRLDLEEELDANKVEEIRAKIEDGIDKLNERLNKIKKTKKNKRKSASSENETLVKEAQKITGVQGTYVTVPLIISAIARICINGTVSAGHDLSQTYKDQVEKYKLSDREKAEVRWLLLDMGYALRGDRGFMPEEEVDESSSNNYDFMANFRG